ncbi:hypothetical protein BaRGS_00019271 [Batillaria attramentaria]|uniref:Phosphopantothenate--cysteine ligase n=1 Tax=Batillaria attramentaria TaxID=370345 RepID=A0ABD0KQL0_9CAEN
MSATTGATVYDDFFEKTALPDKFEEKKSEIEKFITLHKADNRRVVLVTSGGTTVPLESRTVRFIDNFSIGTRGSASAEYFLDHDYAVIFLHRQRSLLPFHRHIQHNILDCLTIMKDETATSLLSILQRYHDAQSKQRLLPVSFTSLGDYLHMLRAVCMLLQPLGCQAMLYLAAAVSDFYIPSNMMLSLQLVPKMLTPLVKDWTPQAFVISFKLETDKSILIRKARKALEEYQHKVVVANVLDTRKTEVVLVTNDSEEPIRLTQEEVANGTEIEEKLIQTLSSHHSKFCASQEQS